MKYAYILLQKRAADVNWSCVNWYTRKQDAEFARSWLRTARPHMQTKVERHQWDDRNQFFRG